MRGAHHCPVTVVMQSVVPLSCPVSPQLIYIDMSRLERNRTIGLEIRLEIKVTDPLNREETFTTVYYADPLPVEF